MMITFEVRHWEGDSVQLFVVEAEGGELRQRTDIQGAVCNLHEKPAFKAAQEAR